MFGESDSESPRVPSPWDSFNSTPTHNKKNRRRIPQLVPENEEGNVEYKLHLLSPSPSRFTHLVTQLKWRLLEGGGQAYYELGISDSGVLVGLSTREMEDTLATLEEMAGEIDASVIVVKEIEVPIDMSGIGSKVWRQMPLMSEDSETTTITETVLETTDPDDNHPTTDIHLEMFSIDQHDHLSPAGTVDLEIAIVHKPRPFRRRVSNTVQGHSDRRRGKGKRPNHLLAHPRIHPSSHSEHHAHHSRHNHPVSAHSTEPQVHPTSECKKSKRRAARDKRHEAKHNPLPLHVPTVCINVEEVTKLDSDLHPPFPPPEIENCGHEDTLPNDNPDSPVLQSFKSPTAEIEKTSSETLLIVEALVVRKMSLEEAFLDFEGFSVC